MTPHLWLDSLLLAMPDVEVRRAKPWKYRVPETPNNRRISCSLAPK